ncbi:MAG: hypothetical protein ATN34_01015 [Epulopiscium sp. Nele67-Bin002]|nr:MAG: hypothetical protein ATN34_01015 [Epulopiscium sp. Nele67-Bin002]
MAIYIKVFKKSSIVQKDVVTIKDLAEIITLDDEMAKKIQELVVLKFEEKKPGNYLVSITDILRVVQEAFPDAQITPIGEADALIQYSPTPMKKNKFVELIKVGVVAAIMFAGSTIAIMAYQIDTSFTKTLTALNKVFTGQVDTNPLWITIPYAIGMPIGVIVFFNHLGNKKITEDPTPIEIEIDKYKDSVENSLIDALTNIRRGSGESTD